MIFHFIEIIELILVKFYVYLYLIIHNPLTPHYIYLFKTSARVEGHPSREFQ